MGFTSSTAESAERQPKTNAIDLYEEHDKGFEENSFRSQQYQYGKDDPQHSGLPLAKTFHKLKMFFPMLLQT